MDRESIGAPADDGGRRCRGGRRLVAPRRLRPDGARPRRRRARLRVTTVFRPATRTSRVGIGRIGDGDSSNRRRARGRRGEQRVAAVDAAVVVDVHRRAAFAANVQDDVAGGDSRRRRASLRAAAARLPETRRRRGLRPVVFRARIRAAATRANASRNASQNALPSRNASPSPRASPVAPYTRASRDSVAAAAADATAEARRLRDESRHLRSALASADADARRARAECASAAAAGDAERARFERDVRRFRSALADADERLRAAEAELRRVRGEASEEIFRAKRRRANCGGVASGRIQTTRRGGFGGDGGARARAEEASRRAREALGEADEERFELRRALEAHVGALVEAKVDAADLQGSILELRKELSKVKVMYQRAAARATKLEAMVHTREDSYAKEGMENDATTRS